MAGLSILLGPRLGLGSARCRPSLASRLSASILSGEGVQRARVTVNQRRRLLTPAPSAAWDPSRERRPPPSIEKKATDVLVTLMLPEDAALEVHATPGSTLLDALEAADLSDVWDTRGACGGACQCSTCRVVVVSAPAPLPPRSEDEDDMLDTAASAAARQPDADPDVADAYLDEASRLACQLELRPEDSGLVVTLPDDVLNVLEVPLWLRGSR